MNIHIVYSTNIPFHYYINNTLYISLTNGWVIYPGGKE